MAMANAVNQSESWHVFDKNNVNVGPITKSEIRRLSFNGSISKGSLVWQEGMRDWTPLGDVTELKDL